MGVLAGFLVGLIGSLHCVGMCGPLVLALPLTRQDKLAIITQSIVYNSGRILIYGLLGFVLGWFGWWAEISGYQTFLAVAIGILLVIMALYSMGAFSFIKKISAGSKFSNMSFSFIKRLFTLSGNFSALKVGMINGFLPCGLVYVALASSITLGSAWQSMFYMILFGLGTVPMMLTVMIGGRLFKNIAIKVGKYLPVFTLLLGVFLIYRGINLELPVTPEVILTGVRQLRCH